MSNEDRMVCPRCAAVVYKSGWPRHDRDCASVTARFGSAGEMAASFRDDVRLTTADLAQQLPGVNARVIHRMLIAAGIAPDDIAARGKSAERPQCGRCGVLLDARGVRRGTSDPTLCGWCDGTAPDGRAEPPDDNRVAEGEKPTWQL